MLGFHIIKGGVTAPLGFDSAAINADIKGKGLRRPDLGVIYSRQDCICSGVFTKNVVKAAPVIWDMEVAKRNNCRLIIANSGNANASTGKQGLFDVESIAKKASEVWKVDYRDVAVCSTGVIGVKLPTEKILPKMSQLKKKLGRDIRETFARAIMTTDLFKKSSAVSFDIDGRTVTIGAVAKGSGMIHPDMATMLAFFTTDVAISGSLLDKAFKMAVERSFNLITIDGDTSTNDSAFILCNKMAGNTEIQDENSPHFEKFYSALEYVAMDLAKMIAKDGEGATKLITITVQGLADFEKSKVVAKAIACSNLVKTAFFGNDPNWGRILAAAGAAGVDFDPSKVEIILNKLPIVQDGIASEYIEADAVKEMKKKEVELLVDFHMGEGIATVWTCDFSYDYVKINASYRS